MDTTRQAPARAAESRAAQLAKAALRRLVLDKLEPTPENYARAYAQESGETPPPAALAPRAQKLLDRLSARVLDGDALKAFGQAFAAARWDQAEQALEQGQAGDGAALATLVEKLVRGIERGSKQWTTGRKKESLQRVLEGSRGDARRLQQRLTQLVASWETETAEASPGEPVDAAVSPESAEAPVPAAAVPPPPQQADPAEATAAPADWGRAVGALGATAGQALPPQDSAAQDLARALAEATTRLLEQGGSPAQAAEVERLCHEADRVLQHRHHLLDQMGVLCQELTASLTDLAEDDSWAKGQCEAMQLKLDEGLSARGVRSVAELLRDTRERQAALRSERERARDALKSMINRMLAELGELGSTTGRFHDNVGRYADVIEKADSLESLAGVVREMVEESRTVQALVQQAQERLHTEHTKATELTQRVGELETELRRLSDEVSTDQLTQIANRRGLIQAFDAERARVERGGQPLALGLLDIDNFKRLNDELGHAAGDEALKALAARVSQTLRPTDKVARYGGEEFVVMLPDTGVEEGQQILTRLQRSLTGGLFMHDNRQILVTFSAGVTAYRPGEKIEQALERADVALYEAKRTGKNRTCVG